MPATEFTPWASLAGGALIGASAVLLLLVTGRLAGISGIVRRLFPPYDGAGAPLEAGAFLLALVASPIVWTLLVGEPVRQTVTESLSLATTAGLLVGAGVFAARGCTSGHGVCGLARLSRRSIAATVIFMATAAATVYAVRHSLGGWPWA